MTTARDEPFFIRQTNAAMTPDERQEWIAEHATDARLQGATWMRASVHPQLEATILECWHERPEHEGDIRWQLATD